MNLRHLTILGAILLAGPAVWVLAVLLGEPMASAGVLLTAGGASAFAGAAAYGLLPPMIPREIEMEGARYRVFDPLHVYDADGFAVHDPEHRERVLKAAGASPVRWEWVSAKKYRQRSVVLLAGRQLPVEYRIFRRYIAPSRLLSRFEADGAVYFATDLGHVFDKSGEQVTPHARARALLDVVRSSTTAERVMIEEAFPEAHARWLHPQKPQLRSSSRTTDPHGVLPAAMLAFYGTSAEGGMRSDFHIDAGSGGGSGGGSDWSSGGGDFGGGGGGGDGGGGGM